MKLVVFISLLFVGSALSASLQDRLHFMKWAQEHGKFYADRNERQYRLEVFAANKKFITEFPSRNPDSTFNVSLNKFADLTVEEFSKMYNTLKYIPKQRLLGAKPVQLNPSNPASIDWRDKGAVTGVKDQGQCGSCYTFSATGSSEGCHQISTGNLVSLSEQNLVDCSQSYGNQGCNGGLMDYCFQYIINNGGIDTEDSYPYTAQDGNCQYDPSNVGATLSGFTDVQQYSESDLQNKIVTGPTSVAIDASHSSFQFYSGGVYYESQCSQDNLDHGVLAVGYGTDSGNNFYWVKNSWGEGWGLNGYIKMSRNKNNNCGIATAASIPQC